MFEEIAVWKKVDRKTAIRFVGFRNLGTNYIWIAFGNFVVADGERHELSAENLICAQSTLEYFLDNLPTNPEVWKPTIAEAVSFFEELNPSD